MYLLSFTLTEPEDNFYFYSPGWLNVFESHLYNKALKATSMNGWGFKRFGMTKDGYTKELIRKPQYIKYIEAMEEVSDAALQNLKTRQRMQLLKSRTAFIYVDSWGESGGFEDISSALHTSTIDTLPKNLVKKFSVKDLTCKIRGEKQSMIQAMRMAEDYLNWDVFDFVVICAAYRAIPLLVFSDEDVVVKRRDKHIPKMFDTYLTVERVGCFIFSQQESEIKVNCGHYVTPSLMEEMLKDRVINDQSIDLISFAGTRKDNVYDCSPQDRCINLVDIYGSSGCLTPALSWEYLNQHALSQGRMRTILPDNNGGYNYFDTSY